MMGDILTILQGDCRAILPTLANGSVQCCVTSPPYWGLRDYGVANQLGLEPTPEEYVANLVGVFREVWRVLRDDGTLWLNLGDSYARDVAKGGSGPNGKHDFIPDYGNARKIMSESKVSSDGAGGRADRAPVRVGGTGIKAKDLVGIPWMVAFALRADGWYLRSDVIWHKPNPMPESVLDRPTRSHEYLFLLAKSSKYFYDADAIAEPSSVASDARRERDDARSKPGWNEAYGGNPPRGLAGNGMGGRKSDKQRGHSRRHAGFNDRWDGMERAEQCSGMRNKRDVWTVATNPYSEAHFATFPPNLIKPCILAGTKTGDVVLDPFGGSGTTGMVALELGRRAVLIELNPEYGKLIEQRTNITPGFGL